jgi:hypothetical protein
LGSLNVDTDSAPANLHQEIDRGCPTAAFTIPRQSSGSMVKLRADFGIRFYVDDEFG